MTKEITLLGINLIPDFITEAEEQEILSHIEPTVTKKSSERNSIKRWGSPAPYNNFIKGDRLPDYILVIADYLVRRKLLEKIPAHATLNEFQRGQVVKPHVDSKESGDIITVLSLLSHATMKMQRGEESFLIELAPRSLLQMKGDARWLYTHEILPVNSLRYSIVFRC